MLNQITFYPVLGMPLIIWGGIFTLLCLIFTTLVAILHEKGITTIPFKWHGRMAIVTLVLSLIHGLLGVLSAF
jgi:hypothetical protein